MIAKYAACFIALSAPVFAGPVYRLVDQLDGNAVALAQQRDDSATRALSNTNIRTSGGKCLFVDQLSGDSAANLTPIQVAACGATAGQGFDVITAGKHNDAANSFLIVSTLTQACFTFDPTQATGKQVMLFSCGGVADGTGNVTTSQLFSGDVSTALISLTPENQPASCFTVKGNSVDIADCDETDAAQGFTFDGVASESDGKVESITTGSASATATTAAGGTDDGAVNTLTCNPVTVTESVTVTVTAPSNEETSSTTTDTTTTTTLFITVGPPTSATQDGEISSTTTVFITVPMSSAAETASTAVPSTQPAASSRKTSDPQTIPQISINPTTTVVESKPSATSANAVDSSIPAKVTASKSSVATIATTAAPQSSSKVPSDPNTIPQISINPSTTVIVA